MAPLSNRITGIGAALSLCLFIYVQDDKGTTMEENTMHQLRVRQVSLGIYVLLFFVCSAFEGMCIFMLNMLRKEPLQHIFIYFIVVVICALIILVAIILVIQFYKVLTVITITPTNVSVSYPFRKATVIKRETITAFGLIALRAATDRRSFICYESKENIMDSYERNKYKHARKYNHHNKGILKNYIKSDNPEEELWYTALTVYARYEKKPKMVYFEAGDEKNVILTISQILDMKSAGKWNCPLGSVLGTGQNLD